ncbi:hypothetical protein J4573_08525 [Actinomadura barringtoniae]|uniref:Uncharacterized protein n=1 Tax=Actinomadura barringtoniae TaxID=1427535 RepID=A0A939T3S1_9ACTN|nr:hypothetical protein [Actinomadura barringtoniae]MBO2447129.1 hypothetical protein [Actinomadura barringtoniae]
MAWLVSGEIFIRCRRKGLELAARPRLFTADDRTSLAIDTIVPALRDFRCRALIGGGWEHQRGAALTTYFVGRLPTISQTPTVAGAITSPILMKNFTPTPRSWLAPQISTPIRK